MQIKTIVRVQTRVGRFSQHVHASTHFLSSLAARVFLVFGTATIAHAVEHTAVDNLGAYDQGIARVQSLISDYEFQHALTVLQELRRLQSHRPEANYLIGLVHYRMEHYADAVDSLDQVVTAHPEYWAARQQRWIAMLARDAFAAETMAQIDTEIRALLSHVGEKAEALYTAYRGYYYLNRRPERIALLKRAAQLAKTEALRQQIAASVSEEMLTARQAALRARLSELYLQTFYDQRDLPLASRIFVDTSEYASEPQEKIHQIHLTRFPNNRHLKYAIAERLVRSGSDEELAERLLNEHRVAWRNAGTEQHAYLNEDAWNYLRRRERARADFLYGVLLMNRSRYALARTWLTRALLEHPQPEQVFMQLAILSLLQEDPHAAIEFVRQALASGDSSQETHAMLSKLRAETDHTSEDPRRDYALKENIPTFTDVTQNSGLGGISSQRIAWGDYNGDGFDDLLLDGPRLLQNDQGKRFREVTDAVGLSATAHTTGGSWADVDNDGFLDLLLNTAVTNFLYRNQKGVHFIDATEAMFGGTHVFLGRSEAAAWGDLDNDGWLDLYLANYEKPGPERGRCYRDQLFRNLAGTRFRDYTRNANARTDAPLCGRGVVWTDINDDGWQDILVANYRLHPNVLWLNDGFGRFKERSRHYDIRGNNVEGAFGHTIGIAVGDVDNDGVRDLYVSNLAHPRYLDFSDQSQLLLVKPGGSENRYEKSGIRFEESSADPSFADVDNDGDLDLYITSIYRGRNSHLYRNQGNGRFTDISWLSNTRVENAWGTGFADFDNDGDLDLLVASSEGVRLLRNDGNENQWLQVSVESRNCNRFGIGSKITLRSEGVKQVREIHAGRGTGSQDSHTVHFGLGRPASQSVDLEVRDLCGGAEQKQQITTNQRIRIVVE